MSSINSTRSVTSKYDEIQLPDAVPSGVVAISTVMGVLLGAALLIVLVHLRHKIAARCESWMREHWRHGDQVGRAKRARDEEGEGEPDKLREDSVVIHDVGFPEEAYYKHDRTHVHDHRPQPSPSMFKDGAFFDELMTSYDEICSPSTRTSQDTIVHIGHVQEIIDDVVEKITGTLETVDLGLGSNPNSNNQLPLRRNSSYKEALDHGLDFSVDMDESLVFSPNNPFTMESCTYDDLNPFSNSSPHVTEDAIIPQDEGANVLAVDSIESCADDLSSLHRFGNQEEVEDDHNVCLEIDEAMLQIPNTKRSFPSNCKWQSTPILGLEDSEVDDDERREIMGASDDETDNSLFNALKVSRSYSPVYKMSFNSSFGNMTRHNYSSFVNDDKE